MTQFIPEPGPHVRNTCLLQSVWSMVGRDPGVSYVVGDLPEAVAWLPQKTLTLLANLHCLLVRSHIFFGVFDFSFKVASSPTRGRATVPGGEHEQLKTSLLVYTRGQLGAHRTLFFVKKM